MLTIVFRRFPGIIIEKTTFEEFEEIFEQILKEEEIQYYDYKEIFLYLILSAELPCLPAVSTSNSKPKILFYYYYVLFSFYIFNTLPHVNDQQLVLHVAPPPALPPP